MEFHLTAETEAKLNALAQRTHRGTDELLDEAVEHLFAFNEWFEQKVKDGMAVIQRGEVVPDEEVRSWLEQRERPKPGDCQSCCTSLL
jgi:predicted transcriptional regulator